MDDNKFRDLNFVLTKDIWLEFDKDAGEVLDWITHKPKDDNGYISKGTILLYSHTYMSEITTGEYTLSFIEIPLGNLSIKDTGIAEFLIVEVDKFVNSGVFKLIDKTDISSCILTPNGILIDNTNILNTDNISIIMGIDEAKHIMIGTKVPLSDIITGYIKNYTRENE